MSHIFTVNFKNFKELFKEQKLLCDYFVEQDNETVGCVIELFQELIL